MEKRAQQLKKRVILKAFARFRIDSTPLGIASGYPLEDSGVKQYWRPLEFHLISMRPDMIN